MRLRLLQIGAGQATGASSRRVGMAGRAPRSETCWRTAWLLKPRSATTQTGTPGLLAASGVKVAPRDAVAEAHGSRDAGTGGSGVAEQHNVALAQRLARHLICGGGQGRVGSAAARGTGASEGAWHAAT